MSKPKLLILGTGWGGTSLLRALRQPTKYDITIASSRDHMLFTPLLTSTATGALEHRSIIEPIRPLATRRNATFLNAHATQIIPQSSSVKFKVPSSTETTFEQPYDILVVSIGATVNTFGVPGVQEHALFMKEAHHAREVRKRMHDAFEAASLPVTTPHERRALLTFVVCGAGPTGVELTAEIADWLRDMALSKRYERDLVDNARVVLVEASGDILSSFDHSLRSYALRRLRASRVEVKLGAAVKRVEKNVVVLIDSNKSKHIGDDKSIEEIVPCGMVVWTAGVKARDVIENCKSLQKNEAGSHLLTDKYLLCQDKNNETVKKSSVFAIGDCARMEHEALVPIAQVAEQQGIYVAGVLDRADVANQGISNVVLRQAATERFSFASKGMLAYVGAARGVAAIAGGKQREKQVGGAKGETDMVKWSGFMAWLVWRYAYFSKLGSFRNKLQVPLDWTKTAIFGRDVSSF